MLERMRARASTRLVDPFGSTEPDLARLGRLLSNIGRARASMLLSGERILYFPVRVLPEPGD
jgi:hypothetical protein